MCEATSVRGSVEARFARALDRSATAQADSRKGRRASVKAGPMLAEQAKDRQREAGEGTHPPPG